jgi:hypothetical protein
MPRDWALGPARLRQTQVLDAEVTRQVDLAVESLPSPPRRALTAQSSEFWSSELKLEPGSTEAPIRDRDDQLAATSAWCEPAVI